jgi:chemotaxis protein methyltransferase CheR
MMSDGDFAKLRAIIHDQTGITIGETRKSLLVSRLRPRLRALGLGDYASYIDWIAGNEEERQELTDRVTTNETYFHRTPRIWSYFADTCIPEFVAAKRGRAMRVWSAAASTGEEGHTAGVFLEETRSRTPGFDYVVLGTDISARVIDIAAEGLYRGRPVARFRADRPELFARHMAGSDEEGWQVTPQIRSRIRFRQHNLLTPLTGTAQFDVIFLRNVLIYFTSADQERILSQIRRLLHPQGVLFIGESESLTFIESDFEQVEPIIYRPVARTPGVPA